MSFTFAAKIACEMFASISELLLSISGSCLCCCFLVFTLCVFAWSYWSRENTGGGEASAWVDCNPTGKHECLAAHTPPLFTLTNVQCMGLGASEPTRDPLIYYPAWESPQRSHDPLWSATQRAFKEEVAERVWHDSLVEIIHPALPLLPALNTKMPDER